MAFKLGDRGSQARVQGLRSLRTGRIRSEEEDERQRKQQEFIAKEARKERKFRDEQGGFWKTLGRSVAGLPKDLATMGIGELMPSTQATTDYRTAAAKAMQGQERRAGEMYEAEGVESLSRDNPMQEGEDPVKYWERIRKLFRADRRG